MRTWPTTSLPRSSSPSLGIVTFFVAFVVVDRLTPFDLWKEIIEDQNSALAILIGLWHSASR